MGLTMFQVDAFATEPFKGNPAAVVPLEGDFLPADVMLNIAAENNLAETAFFVRRGEGQYDLKWFTPTVEMDLCGHATLASAFVLYERLGETADILRFQTRSGELTVERQGDLLMLDFPSRQPVACEAPEGLIDAIGREPKEIYRSRDYLMVYETEDDVRAIKPNFMALLDIPTHAVIVTAPGSDCDFVSRFFAPEVGVPEDPVTGSAHCTLIPYWAERLGKTELYARQISARGGELVCELRGERVRIGGRATLFMTAEIYIGEISKNAVGS
ncbi:MAG: PhzF family phenazine biosynthesis protein [Pyrinomonadaceae bacterium]